MCPNLSETKQDDNVQLEVYHKLSLLLNHHSCFMEISVVNVSTPQHVF
jgi:hypothetical protein